MSFAPTQISDIVVASNESRQRLKDLCSGLYPRSNTRSMIVLLTGPYGTGKTCLAEMLPAALEHAYFRHRTPRTEPFPYRYIDCRKTPISGKRDRRHSSSHGTRSTAGIVPKLRDLRRDR